MSSRRAQEIWSESSSGSKSIDSELSRYLSALDVAWDMASAPSRKSMGDMFLRALVVLSGARALALLSPDIEGNECLVLSCRSASYPNTVTMPVDTLEALRKGETALVASDSDLSRLRSRESSEEYVLEPLRHEARLVAVLVLLGAPLPKRGYRAARFLLDQAGRTLSSRFQSTDLEGHWSRLSDALDELPTFLAEGQESERDEKILKGAASLVGAERASLFFYDEEKKRLRIAARLGFPDEMDEDLFIKPGEGVCGEVFRSGKPVLVRKASPNAGSLDRYRRQSYLSVPLGSPFNPDGVVNMTERKGDEPFTDLELNLLVQYLAQVSLQLERAHQTKKLATLEAISLTDELTGLSNRRHFRLRINEEFDRSRRHGHPLSILMADLDHFKNVNDVYGHAMGDLVLKLAAETIRDTLRTHDLVFRYGGEEFCILLPETGKEGAAAIAERIRERVEDLSNSEDLEIKVPPFSISIGIATYPEDTRDLDRLIKNADTAMYSAKATGRNRVMLFKQS